MKYAVLIAALCFTSMVNAGEKRKVIYPGGRVVWEEAKPASVTPVSATTTLPDLTHGCKCDPNTPGQYCDNCKPGLNKPSIVDVENGQCPDGKSCLDLPVDVIGELETERHDEKFYIQCKDYSDVKVDGPKLVTRCKETREFKTHSYTIKCCKITVCVPCKDCKEITEECEIAKIVAPKIKICKRTSTGKYDVYVIGVKGMPKEWMLFLDTDKATIDQYFVGNGNVVIDF